ncbi:MAG: hypothetical protein HY717_10635 [Planctomycetes bacterium]|nr:hypothetical protein [Planctomycetota bacterium]
MGIWLAGCRSPEAPAPPEARKDPETMKASEPELPPASASPKEEGKAPPPQEARSTPGEEPKITVGGVPPPGSPPAYLIHLESAAGGKALDIPVEVADLTKASQLERAAEMSGMTFHLRQYSPRLLIDEKLAPCPPGQGGFPVLHITLKADKKDFDTWLVPGSRLLGQAYLPRAIVECIPERSPGELDDTEKFLRQLYSYEAKFLLEEKKTGRRFILPIVEGEPSRHADPEYTVEILHYYNSYAKDMKTGKPIDQDTRPLNPAVEVRIAHAGQSRTGWLFSRLPEFSQGAEDQDAILRFVYPGIKHPHQRAALTLVDASSAPLKLYVGLAGKFFQAELSPGETTIVEELSLKIAERMDLAKIVQTTRADPRGSPAVLIAWKNGDQIEERWIPMGAQEELRAGKELFWAWLQSSAAGAHGSSLHGGISGGAAAPGGMPAGHPPLPNAPGGQPRLLPKGHPPLNPPNSPPPPPEKSTGKSTEKGG